MDVEGLSRTEPVHVPDVGHQRLPGDDAPGIAGEPRQQVELLARQLELSAAVPCSPGPGVDAQVLNPQLRAIGDQRACPRLSTARIRAITSPVENGLTT